MSERSDRILESVSKSKLSYGDLSKITGISKSALQRYATGETEKIPIDRVEMIAKALGTTPEYIMGWEDNSTGYNIFSIPNIMPLPETKKLPLISRISCGSPILAEDNVDDYVNVPIDVHADFCLICKGDSMINARILDGDIVYIRKQPDVNNGEIAAVRIGDEATLKRVFKYPDKLVLQPENPAYAPLVYVKEEMNEIHIVGKVVGFTSKIK